MARNGTKHVQHLRRREEIAWRDIDGEIVLIDPRSGTVHVLNGPAGRIWMALGDAARVDIASSGDASPEIDAFLRELVENDLVESDAATHGCDSEARDSVASVDLAFDPDEVAPEVIFSRRIEAVASTCAFDPPTTKVGGGDGCSGVTFS